MSIDDSQFRTDAELREDAREQLAGNWGQAVLTFLVYSVIDGAAAALGGIGNLLVGGPMELGLATYFLALKRERRAQTEDVFRGFRNFESAIVLYIVRTIYVVLWTILFIIPGIVAMLRYSMAPYILHDDPGISGMEALRRSKEMTDGYKGRLFWLYLSFIGWAILCIFTLGIGYLWLVPYIKLTEANFYEDLKEENA